MLEETPPPAAFQRRFLNTNTGGVVSVGVPELQDHDVMGPTLGGLLTLRERGTHALRLFNPFTSHLTELPPLTSLLHSVAHDPTLVEPVYHQPTAIGLSDGSTAVAVYCKLVEKVAVARPGDSRWKWISVRSHRLHSAASLMGFFYLVSRTILFRLHSNGAIQQPKLLPVVDLPNAVPSCRLTLAAEDDEKLTLVKEIFYWPHGEEVPSEGFNILKMPRLCLAYAVDMGLRMLMPSPRLDGRALFVGDDRVVWASPGAFSHCHIAADTIYTGRPNRLFTVHACCIEPAGPLKVVLHAHSLAYGLTEHREYEDDDSEEASPKGIVETVASYVASDRGGGARPPLYMASHVV